MQVLDALRSVFTGCHGDIAITSGTRCTSIRHHFGTYHLQITISVLQYVSMTLEHTSSAAPTTLSCSLLVSWHAHNAICWEYHCVPGTGAGWSLYSSCSSLTQLQMIIPAYHGSHWVDVLIRYVLLFGVLYLVECDLMIDPAVRVQQTLLISEKVQWRPCQ